MSLDKEQLRSFEDDGYLIVENALGDDDLNPVIDEYAEYIDRRAHELHAAGALSNTYAGESFTRRLALICEENKTIYPELDIMHFRGSACFGLLGNENLLDMVECFVGPEIICSPIQHVRPKLPTTLAPGADAESTHVAPWHQDAGVTWSEADPYFILTVWIPFVDATPENGCLQIFPRVHGQGLRRHEIIPVRGTTIVPAEMPTQEPLSLPMKKGSVLFMHKQIPHRSTPNVSASVRWSADLRYQKTGTPTGRPFHPEFVVRSRADPTSVLREHAVWSDLWREALAGNEGVQLHRWNSQQQDEPRVQ